MTVDPERGPQVAAGRKAWVHPQLARLPVAGAEFGGGAIPDLDAVPS